MLAIATGCEFDVERGPDWLLVRLKNFDLAEPDSPPLADQIWSLMQRHFTYRLVLELDRVLLLNSSLIGQLVQLYRRIEEHDGVMRLCGLSSYNCQTLRACHLAEQLSPYQDRQEAVMGCRRPR